MEEDNKGSTDASRASASFISAGDRQRFTVDLKPGETTIVSWKKLVKDSKLSGHSSVPATTPANTHPALESRIAPGQPSTKEPKDEPPTNRFSAVIEKIERLYVGKQSSDEEDLADVPDDDQYDTDDSFIDDAELDEYFEVDKATTKHSGFFINRGKLEQITEPTLLPNQKPRKRRRKEVENTSGENKDGPVTKHVKVATKVVERSGDPSLKEPNNQLSTPIASPKKKSTSSAAADPSTARLSEGTMPSSEPKDIAAEKTNIQLPCNLNNKQKDPCRLQGFSDRKIKEGNKRMHLKSFVREGVKHAEPEILREGKSVLHDLPDLNAPSADRYSSPMPKSQHTPRKDGSSIKTKVTSLEKAVRELERTVADARPAIVVHDADPSAQVVKKRLPREVKQKLAKVARVAQASHGKISQELINRLIPILGHWLQPRSLKRHLKIMISLLLSAKKEKDDRFQHIKREVTEMIKTQFSSTKLEASEQVGGTLGDSREIDKGLEKKTVNMTIAMEDKICDLYDLYIDGLEENAAPQIKKLYMDLAEMWPNGCMDSHRVKRAICRAKDRKKLFHSRKMDSEKVKRKKSTPRTEGEGCGAAQHTQYGKGKSVGDGRTVALAISPTAAAAIRVPTTSRCHMERSKPEKVKKSSYIASNGTRVTANVARAKKAKRKSEMEDSKGCYHPPSGQVQSEKNKLHNQIAGPVKPSTDVLSASAQCSEPVG